MAEQGGREVKRLFSAVLLVAIPEGVELSFQLAGGVSRFLAWFIDLFVILALSLAAAKTLSLAAVFGGSWRQALTLIAYFVLSIGYTIFCEWWWRGQTVGKRLFHLRVMDADGFRLSFAQIVIRNLLRLVDVLPIAYLIGGAAAAFSKNHQRLGDLAAGTVVVREANPQQWRLPDMGTQFNSLAMFPQLVARVRHSASRDLIRVAISAVLRRGQLLPPARVALFDEIRAQFSSIVSFPESATEYMTSEQYVRNILSAIFAR